ncbi:hypothetical protein BKH43_01950 [Helicobacter sp. 13S00401-1]|uniref:hypothetical protein n=1 Tax=Helicobacter sp. 13S00401-1 TaxID=1905758 RepID=UPI000BA6011C|nr:hypothetical protein [Helicobacter sp. 13S00401-1]PAF51426.1 hypothetical protein BKH43_01950 [Helicobacter sp. 13S00401-1]
MLMFGFYDTNSLSFKFCDDLKDINSLHIPLLKPVQHTLAKYCQDNGVAHSLYLNNYFFEGKDIAQIIAHINLGAEYVLCENPEIAKAMQDIVEKYVLTLKVLVLSDEKSLNPVVKECLKASIDGIINRTCILES